MSERGRLHTDLLALGLLGASVFTGLSLYGYSPADPPAQQVFPAAAQAQNLAGEAGAWWAFILLLAFGGGAYFMLGCMALTTISLFARRLTNGPILRLLGWALMQTAVCAGLRALLPNWSPGPVVGGGGYLGAVLWMTLDFEFEPAGVATLLGSGFLLGLVLTTDVVVLRLFSGIVFGPARFLRALSSPRLLPSAPRAPDATVAAAAPTTARVAHTAASSNPTKQPKPVVEPVPNREFKINSPRSIPLVETADHEDETAQPAVAPRVGLRSDCDLLPPLEESRAPDHLEEDEEIEDEPLPVRAAPPPAPVARAAEPARRPAPRPARPAAKPAPAALPERKGEYRVNSPRQDAGQRAEIQAERDANQGKSSYELPDLDLLEAAEEFPYEYLAERARVAAETLEKAFKQFGLNVRVVEIDTGPVITQFELELEAGLRLNKITALADDLAIALRVPSVRVVSPIPGKNTVGVEVPNDKQIMVRLRELIESCPDAMKKRIPVFLGKDVSGRPLVIDLAKMPHLLIAGRTGTGKSVCLNTLISSILMTRTPDQVRLLMIDPKMVELSPYMRIPHLMHPVITDMKKAEAMLGWAVEKMEERYDLLARTGVRHLDSYNEMPREQKLQRLQIDADSEEAEAIPDSMPYIVIIADEMADMMMTSGKEVESHIIRLAQKSRAVGIHLVLATQKPTVDVITGLIKSNLPARIAFQVASRTDSRVVLDEMGADKLLGNGDMLYLAPGGNRISRAQGTYISDEEVNKLIEYYGQYETQYSRELTQLQSRSSAQGGIEAIRARDELYEAAIDVVVREGRGSVSLLQRALGIGYGRAARLVDYMAEDGIVGEYNGSQAREVLYSPDQWEAFRGGVEEDAYA